MISPYEGQSGIVVPELPLEHFSLQLQFAQRAAEISGMPLEQAIMEYTQFWRRVGNEGWSFDPNIPSWQELIARVDSGEPADTVAYNLYSRNLGTTDSEKSKVYFGCFRFDFNPEFDGDTNVIKIHFKNNDKSGFGPLSKGRQGARFEDLQQMFAFVLQNYPQAQVVHGGSWVYNLNAYRRSFPTFFTENMKVEEVPFPRSSGIWGQFLDSDGKVKPEVAQRFLERVQNAMTLDQLLQCFEFKILFPRGDIKEFYRFYGIV
jgi:hypothetical protein